MTLENVVVGICIIVAIHVFTFCAMYMEINSLLWELRIIKRKLEELEDD